jgi:hypothetical protein
MSPGEKDRKELTGMDRDGQDEEKAMKHSLQQCFHLSSCFLFLS